MDEQQLSISPDTFESYLKRRSWTPVATWRGMMVWERTGHEADQVLVPIERNGYAVRKLLQRAVVDLAAAEERALDELLAELESPNVDTQTFRLFPSTPSGTIPFTEGRKAIEAIYQLLRDAGRNVHEGHKLLYQHRASEPVYRFIDRVQLGLTAPGSYVFTTRTPGSAGTSDSRQTPLSDLDDEADHAVLADHNIVRRLYEAVWRAHSVAETLIERRDIDDPAATGLSANFCKALAELGGSDHDRSFEIGFQWGFGHRTALPDSSVRFTELMTAKIHEFGVRLEGLAETGNDAIEGNIIALSREEVGLRRRAQIKGPEELVETGNATVEGKVIGLFTEEAGHRRRAQIKGRIHTGQGKHDGVIWVFVTDRDYDRAISAHRADHWVTAQGDLRLENNSLRLYLGSNSLEVLND